MRRSCRLVRISAAVCGLAALLPAVRAAEPPDYLPVAWGMDEGLPQHMVSAVLQSAGGDVWCSTFNGLARFDGVKFTVFDEHSTPPILNRGVTTLYEDRAGTLWLGGVSGSIDCVRDRAPVAPPPVQGEGRGQVLSLAGDGAGDTWALWQDRTLARMRDGLVLPLPPEVDPSETELRLVAGEKELWLVHRTGFGRVTPEGVQLVPAQMEGEQGPVYRAAAAPDGGLWVITPERIRRWKDGAWLPETWPAPWEAQHYAYSMTTLKDGRLAVGMVHGGVFVGMPGGRWMQYDRRRGLSHEWVRGIAEDAEGNVWVATGGGGLVAMRPRRVEMIDVESGESRHNVLTISVAPDGAVWTGTEGGGIFRVQGRGITAFGADQGLENVFVWTVMAENGVVRAGGWNDGMFVSEGERFVRDPAWSDVSAPVSILHRSGDGQLWAGGLNGLARLENGSWTLADSAGQPWSPPHPRSVAEAGPDSLWLGLGDGRLARRTGERLEVWDHSSGLSRGTIQSLCPGPEGAVWLGTAGGGLGLWQNGKVRFLTVADGLPSNGVTQVTTDRYGHLWAGTYRGLCRPEPDDLAAWVRGGSGPVRWLLLTKADGLGSLECTAGGQPGTARTADGRLWFPTNRGLAVVDPDRMERNTLPPPVVIESLTVNEHPVAAGVAEFGPGAVRMNIEFTALSFRAPERVQFRHILEGLETEWRESAVRSVNYAWLGPGEYTFRVTACNNDGVWNGTGAALTFAVLPQFWQTLAFQVGVAGLGALAVGGAVWGIARRRARMRLARVERSHAVERERARIARDIHDDLGAGLTRIALLSQAARSDLPPDNPASADLEQVCEAAESLTHAMDEIVWAVDPRHDTLDSLVTYLGGFAQQFLSAAGVRFRLEAPASVPHIPVPADVRHGLYLAVKEALHNVVRHAGARTAVVAFAMEPGQCTVTVRDDGTGFTPGETVRTRAGGGNGLANMQGRLTEIGGRFALCSGPGTGTQVVLTLPLPAQG